MDNLLIDKIEQIARSLFGLAFFPGFRLQIFLQQAEQLFLTDFFIDVMNNCLADILLIALDIDTKSRLAYEFKLALPEPAFQLIQIVADRAIGDPQLRSKCEKLDWFIARQQPADDDGLPFLRRIDIFLGTVIEEFFQCGRLYNEVEQLIKK